MPEPEVQQLPGGGCLTSYFFCTCPVVFCLGYFPILPYALSSYWHFVLRPLHFIFFSRGSTPPATDGGYIYIYIIYTVFWISVSSCFGDGRRVHPKTRKRENSKRRVAAGCTRKRENLKICQKKRNPKTRKSENIRKVSTKKQKPEIAKI